MHHLDADNTEGDGEHNGQLSQIQAQHHQSEVEQGFDKTWDEQCFHMYFGLLLQMRFGYLPLAHVVGSEDKLSSHDAREQINDLEL